MVMAIHKTYCCERCLVAINAKSAELTPKVIESKDRNNLEENQNTSTTTSSVNGNNNDGSPSPHHTLSP